MSSKTKQGRRKAVLLPGNAKRRSHTELPILMAVQAIGTDWFGQRQMNEIAFYAELLWRAGEGEDKKKGHTLLTIAVAVSERHDRTGKWGMTGDEQRTVRAIIEQTIDWMRDQKNVRLQRAIEESANAARKREAR